LPATLAAHETVALPEPVTLVGVTAPHVRPDGRESLRLTAPANPFTAAIVIVEFAEEPALTGVGEDAAIVKSTKLKAAVAV